MSTFEFGDVIKLRTVCNFDGGWGTIPHHHGAITRKQRYIFLRDGPEEPLYPEGEGETAFAIDLADRRIQTVMIRHFVKERRVK